MQYGEIARAYGDLTARMLKKSLYSRTPPLDVTDGVLKQWVLKYRVPAGAVTLQGADELEKRYGAAIRHLVAENRTGYKLQAALKKLTPPLYVSDQASKDWLRKYGTAEPVRQINSAGHLKCTSASVFVMMTRRRPSGRMACKIGCIPQRTSQRQQRYARRGSPRTGARLGSCSTEYR